MNIRTLLTAGAAVLAAAGLLWTASSAFAAPPRAAPPGGAAQALKAACPAARPGHARCFALVARQTAVNAAIAARAAGNAGVTAQDTTPHGWGAKSIESAYQLPAGRNPLQTVAVIDAFSTPRLARDAAVYRQQYHLPACTTTSGCLRIVNQHGQPSPLPASGVPSGWDVETALDTEMVSAACPRCRILIVEATSDSLTDLAAAEDTAARLHASVISNSWGARETGFSQATARAFRRPGHVIVASSGDAGFNAATFPANLRDVTAVGGTQLSRAKNKRGWAERAFFASGSGCSAYVAKPAWQHDKHCPGRTVTDIAALAWNTSAYVSTAGGWLTTGGTSVAAPLIAGTYALAGNAATIRPGREYHHTSALNDITKGNNDPNGTGGAACGNDYLCVARNGYDAPTGLGTPHGTGAF